MKFSSSLILALGLIWAIPNHASSLRGLADEDTPAEETTCDGFEGKLFGLCNAICEAKDCEVEMSEGCQTLLQNFLEASGGVRPPCLCFPKDVSVEVEGKGFTSLENVQIGDRVRTAGGFSEVYAFGTRTLDGENKFLKITTTNKQSIVMTGSHMIFVGKEMKPVLASEVKKGDEVMFMPQKELQTIHSVEIIKRVGAIHPLTRDGSIIVDGILASVHGFDSDVCAPIAKIGAFYLLDKHQFQQTFLSPLRMLCKISAEAFCTDKNHWNDGAHHFFDTMEALLIFLMPDGVGKTGEEVNFLAPTPFLPIKVVVMFWMLIIYAIESMMEHMHGFAAFFLVALTTLAFATPFYTIKTSKVNKCKAD